MVMWKLTNVLLVVGVIVIGVILSLIILFALVKFIEFLIEEVLESIKFYGIKKNKYILIILVILSILISLMIFFILKLVERGVI